jgi:hypothetical protein
VREPARTTSGEDDSERPTHETARDSRDGRAAPSGVEMMVRARLDGIQQGHDRGSRDALGKNEIRAVWKLTEVGPLARDEDDPAVGLPLAEGRPLPIARCREHDEGVLAFGSIERGRAIVAEVLGREQRDASEVPKGVCDLHGKGNCLVSRPVDRDHARTNARWEKLSARLQLERERSRHRDREAGVALEHRVEDVCVELQEHGVPNGLHRCRPR